MYTKDDLYYSDYKWTLYANRHARISGLPDNTPFNRHEGYEVLYLINHLAGNTEEALEMERLIRNVLPVEINRQKDVVEWIAMNREPKNDSAGK